MSETDNRISRLTPYRVYTALLSHSGVALQPPTAIVLNNTLGFVPVWYAGGVGTYFTQNAEFDSTYIDKVATFITPPSFGIPANPVFVFNANPQPSTNGIYILTFKNGVLTDGLLSTGSQTKTTIEIRVYL